MQPLDWGKILVTELLGLNYTLVRIMNECIYIVNALNCRINVNVYFHVFWLFAFQSNIKTNMYIYITEICRALPIYSIIFLMGWSSSLDVKILCSTFHGHYFFIRQGFQCEQFTNIHLQCTMYMRGWFYISRSIKGRGGGSIDCTLN